MSSLRELTALSPSPSPTSSLQGASRDPNIRVSVLREIRIQVHKETTQRYTVIGNGDVRSLPPCDAVLSGSASGAVEADLDWDGEIQINKNVDFGGFNAGAVLVRVCDFPDGCTTSCVHNAFLCRTLSFCRSHRDFLMYRRPFRFRSSSRLG